MTISIRVESRKVIEFYTKLECEVQKEMADETRKIKAGALEGKPGPGMNNEMVKQAETKYLKRIAEIDQKIKMCGMVESVLVSSGDEFIKKI
jgi:hypothetical protein